MLELINLKLTVNDGPVTVLVDPRDTLLDVLRSKLGLTGTKQGCDEGACGACTVIMNGRAVNSCMVLAAEADGARVTTIEGLASSDGNGSLHPIQTAFAESGAVQCGYCTPGMILTTSVLLENQSNPTRHQIRTALSGNLCRCTGYEKIIDAVELASRLLNGGSDE